jgi:hypothetical protein
MEAKEITTIEQYAEELKKGIGKVYINEWGLQMAGPKWPKPVFGFNKEVTWDSIRHFADAIGDLNPLFRDKEYAQKTKYGCLVGPPTILLTIASANYPDPPGFPPLPEFPELYIDEEYELFSPICEGDEIDWKTTFPTDVQVKHGKAMGSVVFEYGRIEFARHRGAIPIATSKFCIACYKISSEQEQKRRDTKPVYTDEYIKEVYAAQDRETVRGAQPRYWEDVEVGEELTPVVRGPFTNMDLVAYIRGGVAEWHYWSSRLYRFAHDHCGWGYYDPDLKIYHNFKDRFDSNIGGTAVAPHRISLLVMLLTNWIGDDGFIWKFSQVLRKRTGFGVVLWCKGKVARKYIQDGRCCIDIDSWMEDQAGDKSIQAQRATVLLPSREYGPVIYPAYHPPIKIQAPKPRQWKSARVQTI